ncbi:hypothetical protein TWF281_008984 [Arthrobotrys megalospora]
MPPGWGFPFGSKKDNASDGSISPPPNSKRDKRKEKSSNSSHGMTHLREYTSGDDPRIRIRSGLDPRANGHFMDVRELGYNTRGDPDFIRSRLVSQLQSSLNTAVTDSIRKACIHYDDEVLSLENNYHTVLEERNGLKIENKSLANRVKTLEQEVNAKVALLREFQSGHLKTAGSRKLAASSTAISTEYEDLERRVKNTVLSRLARLNIHDPNIQVLLGHQPFLQAVKDIMVDEKEAQEAENLPLGLLEVVEESEKKGLLMWMIQGVIHDVLHKKIMRIHMPGLDSNELKVMQKIFNSIALSEEGQGIKAALEWRADTYRRLAYWAENTKELGKYSEASPDINEISQVFGDLIDSTENEIKKILEPFCDEDTTDGKNFSGLIVDIVDRAFQFSILIGSQTARYELHKDIHNTDDFRAVPEHLDDKPGPDNISNASLFYAVPALVKTSSEDGEAYETSELLVQGKIYVLFGIGDAVEEEEEEVPDVPERPTVQLASPVTGGDLESETIDAITKIGTSTEAGPTDKTKVEPREVATDPSTKPSGADTLPNESNPNMKESSDQTPKNESNGVIATTTSSSSENDTPKENPEPANQSSPEAEGLQQETSTKTSQVKADPENQEPQPPATQRTPEKPSEASLSSEHPSSERNFQSLEAHLTEIPASPSLPNLPSIPKQVVPLPQEATAATPEPQCPAPAPVETETVPPVEAKDSTTPASPTASPATEAVENPPPQQPVETQPEISPEPSTSSTPLKQEAALQSEPEHKLKSQLTSSNNEISIAHSTPRTLPAGLTKLNSSSDSSKSPIVATIQEGKGVDVETVG